MGCGGGFHTAHHWSGPYLPRPGPRFPKPEAHSASDVRLKGGHAAAEDPYLWFSDGRWRMMTHQKLDDPNITTGAHDQCSYFPYVGGYAVAKTPGYDGLDGEWEQDFFSPAFGLNVSLVNGSSFCL